MEDLQRIRERCAFILHVSTVGSILYLTARTLFENIDQDVGSSEVADDLLERRRKRLS